MTVGSFVESGEEGPARAVTIIRPSTGWVPLQVSDLWAYRELLYFLVMRDVKVRYKQTVLGVAWAVIQPLLTMLVFTIFFGKLARVPSDGVPYPIFSYAALVPWTFFANGMTQCANSVVGNARLITRVYFPRLTVPVAAVLSGVVDSALSFTVLLCLMVYYGIEVSFRVLWLPGFMLMGFATALGVGLWLAALNVQYRDVRHLMPFLVQFWMLATPIAYPSSLLGAEWRMVFGLNPMAGIVEGFRWALLGVGIAPGPMLVVSALTTMAILVSGSFYFRRVEKTFADVV